MTHPIELLTSYVDGTLKPAERASVDRHLSRCLTCRDEVTLATGARRALRSMASPSSTPADLAVPALAAMQEGASSRPRWARLLPIAAAAAVVGLLAISIPRIGSDGGNDTRAAAEADAADASADDLRLLATDTDLNPESLEAAAEAYVSQRTASQEGQTAEAAPNASAAASGSIPARSLSAGKTAQALRCLRSAFAGFPGQVTRLERVTFEGSPAYLAYVLEGPGAGQPADAVTLWVASTTDCSILSLTSASL